MMRMGPTNDEKRCALCYSTIYKKNNAPAGVKHIVLLSDGPSVHNENRCVERFVMNLCDRRMFESVYTLLFK